MTAPRSLPLAGQETGAQRQRSPLAHCARKAPGAAIPATALTVLDGAPCISVCPECAGTLIIHVRGIRPARCTRCAATRRKRQQARRRELQRARVMTAALALLLILPLLVGACGRNPTEPPPNPCIKVDTLWGEKGATLVLTTYYKPPCLGTRSR